ncbi:hypothetical protein RB195_011231 [Necator americanus]|uniref:Major facilitator superfamily (MFS) profile domain-containing protein n=1 Tax=Necator americanus TaxID=51031 RepID=A0ABR1D2C3_NECAM
MDGILCCCIEQEDERLLVEPMHMMQFALAQAHEVTVHERAYLHAEAGINPKLCRVELVKLGSKGQTHSFVAFGIVSLPFGYDQSNLYEAIAAYKFGWICGKTAYLASLFSQIQFAGVLCGTFSFGAASDIFGRKPVAIVAFSIGVFTNFITGLAPTWQVLMAIRFFVGLSVGGTLVVVCTFVMEMLLPQQRMALRAFFNWGRLEEMRIAERYIARFARIEYKPVAHKKIEHNKNLCEMLHTGGLHRRLFVLWTMWFVASVCGYATDLNSNTISGDFFMNQIIFSILIAVSKMVLVTVDTFIPSFSRRTLHQGAQTVVCLCFLVLFFLTMQGYQGIATLIINVTGTIFIEYTWDACYLCAVESMETSCRASATGTCSLMARVGAIIAPLVSHVTT